ncbi:MAG: bifunctional UDP-N-acetylglucosamine diphosphorylase/glucosamine-1-phosphate N-acetyltransferase GlmU [Alphaproteobacteria bacterium]|nr:bifunctional UDP-N-acetylglucosamine diphosphorylase/glucosamine-1-phosphate N-acetyltransferase GlmU [Alphaproteobacteria bacterium]
MSSKSDIQSVAAVILAAGNGSRLKSSTPKVFHKVGGLPLVDHVVYTASKVGIDDIVVVLNPKYSDFRSKVRSDIKVAFQETPTGTGNTVKFGLERLSKTDLGWVFVLYGDVPLVSEDSLQQMYSLAQQDRNTAVVVLAFDSSDAVNLGKLERAEKLGTIKRIVEAKDTNDSEEFLSLCNAGLLIRRDVLNALLCNIQPSQITKEVYITEIVRLAYEAGYDCRYYEGTREELSGVNTRAELANLEEYFQKKMRRKFLDKGVTLVAPETVFFSYDTEIENDVTVFPYVVFGENVRIRTGAEIGPFCVVEGADIHRSAIGPFSRLRPGSEIRKGAKIGNFVEVKNSFIDEQAKINHLSYIGDSTVGRKSNIGAGTITCNYDGFRKSHTEIGEEVFVGSNTALVAPVTIRDGSIIGAGSVITKDVDENSLAVARGRQINMKDKAIAFRDKKRK